MEMKPSSIAKMVRRAAGTATPPEVHPKAFHHVGPGWQAVDLPTTWGASPRSACCWPWPPTCTQRLGIDRGDRRPDKVRNRVDDLTGQKDFVDALCTIAQDTGLHIHLVCHMRKGENEDAARLKFDIKGAGEITDLVDNILIWKNMRASRKR